MHIAADTCTLYIYSTLLEDMGISGQWIMNSWVHYNTQHQHRMDILNTDLLIKCFVILDGEISVIPSLALNYFCGVKFAQISSVSPEMGFPWNSNAFSYVILICGLHRSWEINCSVRSGIPNLVLWRTHPGIGDPTLPIIGARRCPLNKK